MKKTLCLSLITAVVWIACTRDTFTPTGMDCTIPPTYENGMQALVQTYCAYSECHDGRSLGVPGDYSTYEGMSLHFEGLISNRVIDQRDDTIMGMPPWYATGPTDLSEEDFMLFNCWISDEFPEF